jgi:hypothetical protein
MEIGAARAMFAVGAILTFAVNVHTQVLNLHIVRRNLDDHLSGCHRRAVALYIPFLPGSLQSLQAWLIRHACSPVVIVP